MTPERKYDMSEEKIISKKHKTEDKIEKRDRERLDYNAKHGTNYSYGEYFAYKSHGLLKSNF